MALAQSDYPCFGVGGETVMRSKRPSAAIRKRLMDRGERPFSEFIESASSHLVLRGYIGYRLSPEQRQDSTHAARVHGHHMCAITGHGSDSDRQSAL
jgi:hypothetical protein